MKRRKTLLAVLLSLVGSVLALVPPGKARSVWFFSSSARAPSLRNLLRDRAVERQDIERC